MIENHDFVNAYFTNDDRTHIESVWSDKDTGDLRTFHVLAEEGNDYYTELLKYIDIDTLHEMTFKSIRLKREAFESEVMAIAKEQGKMYDIDELNTNYWTQLGKSLLTYEFDDERDKEALFLYKLQLFEAPAIKESEDRDAKAALRKTKNFIEATHAALSIVLKDKS